MSRNFRKSIYMAIITCLLIVPLVSAKSSKAKKNSAIELSKKHIKAVNRQRRISCHNDQGAPPQSFGVDVKKWVDVNFSLFDEPGSQVDSISWCMDEGNMAKYPSQVIPVDDSPYLKKWLDAGIDIFKVMVEETHKRGLEAFYSYRVNGSDSASGKKYNWAKLPMKEKHPELLIPAWPTPRWNYKFKEVRDYKISILKELAENYDFDGIDLDFSRMPPSLTIGQQWELRDELTDFVRKARLMLLEIEKKRGRPFLFGARVPSTVAGCHYDGLDVETWAKENLVDIFFVGSRSFELDLVGFRRITKGTNIKLYPSIDDYHASEKYRQHSIEFLRAVFSNWYHQGADGAQTYNCHTWSDELGRKFQHEIGLTHIVMTPKSQQIAYHEVGTLETMRFKDKIYAIQRRYGELGTSWNVYHNINCQAQLPAVLGKDNLPTIFTMYIGDDLSTNAERLKNTELKLHLPAGDIAEVKLNGVKLPSPTAKDEWLKFQTTPRQFAVGENLISVRIWSGAKNLPEKVTVEKVEVHVDYK